MTDHKPPLLPSLRAGSREDTELRDALENLSRTAPDETRKQIEAVLRGDLSLRQFATTDVFNALTAPGVTAAEEHIREMSPDELRLAAEKEARDNPT